MESTAETIYSKPIMIIITSAWLFSACYQSQNLDLNISDFRLLLNSPDPINNYAYALQLGHLK